MLIPVQIADYRTFALFGIIGLIVFIFRPRRNYRRTEEELVDSFRANRLEPFIEIVSNRKSDRNRFYSLSGGVSGVIERIGDTRRIVHLIQHKRMLGLITLRDASELYCYALGSLCWSIEALIDAALPTNHYAAFRAAQLHVTLTLKTLAYCQVPDSPPAILRPNALL